MTERRPVIYLVGSFAVAILIGGILLALPLSTPAGKPPIPFLDALFTSTSAVCVTGLTVVDTATAFSPFGHFVILFLIQLGGLGIMTLSVFFLIVAGRRVGVGDRAVMQGVFSAEPSKDFRNVIVSVLVTTSLIEIVGAVVLFVRFSQDFPAQRAAFLAVFHAISAFCNAGFSLFSDNFVRYRGDAVVNITIMLLIVAGGLGFTVIREVALRIRHRRRARSPWSVQTRIVILMTLFLVLAGALVVFFSEQQRTLRGAGAGEQVLASFFQSVTTRTAGYNTLDIASMHPFALFFFLVLMFIGASPGSTGGGVKTTTVGVLLAFARARFKGLPTIHLFHRGLPEEMVTRAFVTVLFALAILFLGIGALVLSEPNKQLLPLAFEAFSAFGTVGLSMDVTPTLSGEGKCVVIALMFLGRVGPLTVAIAVASAGRRAVYAYSEENVMVG